MPSPQTTPARPVPVFPPPQTAKTDLLIIAGEHSGDEHAARMVSALRRARPGIAIAALGGGKLEKAGAQLLYDMTSLSVIGFAEVLKNYGLFRRIFRELLQWIESYAPANICLVDYPGFNLRLARQLKNLGLSRKGGGSIGVFYYISPQIWAWKAKRRFAMSDTLDGLGVIFPFEVDCFKDTELAVEFVGHPFLEEGHVPELTYVPEGPVLLLPGSRVQPVARIFPAMAAAFAQYRKKNPSNCAVVLYPSEEIRAVLEKVLSAQCGANSLIELVSNDGTGEVSAKAVLTSSGTMSLTCGLAGIPGAIAYKAHPLTYFWARRLIRVPYIGIVNLLLKESVYPEFIQGRAIPRLLAQEIENAVSDEAIIENTSKAAGRLRQILTGHKNVSPASWLASRMT